MMKKTLDDYLKDPDLANEPLVIETNLAADEKAVVKAGRRERKEHPEKFTPWAEIRKAGKK